MSVAVYRLMRTTAVLLLLISLSGFLPAAAHAQHLVRVRSTSPAEEGPPGKAEEVSTDAFHATLSKRMRSPRSRSKLRHFLSPTGVVLLLTPSQARLVARRLAPRHDPLSEQITPLRC